MTGLNVTLSEAARCLLILQEAAEPIVAADLARKLGLPGTRETQRRHVRAIIEHLRDNGSMIVANLQEGYELTADPRRWREYLDGHERGAKRTLGRTHHEKKMLTDARGQGVLFDIRVRHGVASVGVG